MRQVHRYRSTDIPALIDIFYSHRTFQFLSESELHRHLRKNDNLGGMTWVLRVDGALKGYAQLTCVPSLEGVFDIDGLIVPQSRRQGLGSFLLKQLLREIPPGQVRQITHAVSSMDSPEARFFTNNGFAVDHEEWQLVLEELPDPAPATDSVSCRLVAYRRPEAIGLFRQLYEYSFKGHPWYQPYLSDDEVAEEMEDRDTIHILLQDNTPVGFIWTRWPTPDVAEFEPLGIIPKFQGQGFGRALLSRAMKEAIARGAQKIQIGVWADNTPAVELYTSFGFKHQATTTYLALDLHRG